MKRILLIGVVLALGTGLLLWTTRPTRSGPQRDATLAQETFEALAEAGRVPGLTTPRGGWIPTPAIAESPPDLLVRHHRNLLMAEVLANARPTPTPPQQQAPEAPPAAKLRQGLALSILAVDPTHDESTRLRDILVSGGIWQPWRVAHVLAATGDARWFPDILAVIDAEPFGFARAQVALALGTVGHPDGAARLEAFLRSHYGTQGYGFGKVALVELGQTDPQARTAVTNAAFALIRNHPSGIRTDGGISWHEDHPGRVSYIQMTAIEVLRNVGTAEDADTLRRETDRLVEPSERLFEYLDESIELMRSRSNP